jgi:uncharacterized pyridoxal phosphate-containing UPF0001 family protein
MNLDRGILARTMSRNLWTKQSQLPTDIRWHFIGHLQSNKVKYIAPFISLIHGVDSLKLLNEINKQGIKISRIIDCLLQVHIAQEETKFGMNENELNDAINKSAKWLMCDLRIDGNGFIYRRYEKGEK